MILVKFVAVGTKKIINDHYEYIDGIAEKLKEQGYADKYHIYINSKVFEDDDPTEFFCDFIKDKLSFSIYFEFGTYNSVKQLTFDIAADDYKLDIDDDYLENLKMFVKQSIIRDWDKVVWLYDEDAYILSKDLYSRLYVTENRIRRFINEFMAKTFGPNWWNLLPDESITGKYKARFAGYKKDVPGFRNIDDHLLSIDVGDLLKILTIKKMSWSPSYDESIEKLLVGNTAGNECKIVESMKSQLSVNEDYWEEYFKVYFDDEFLKTFGELETYRNHVAHNKIIDRVAYKNNRILIDKMDNYMQNALVKLYKENKSFEKLETEAKANREFLMETMQTDAGVIIRDESTIASVFEEALQEAHTYIFNALRFREDLEISDLMFERKKSDGRLFSVLSNTTKAHLDFDYSMDINDYEGEESTLTITCKQSPVIIENDEKIEGFEFVLSYYNGAATYDDEQGYYSPLTEDGIPEPNFNKCVETLMNFINTELDIH